MNLSNIKPAKGARKDRKRVGRGPGSGLGKTSGRGSKGQLAGSGYSRKWSFEGGQMPLIRRIPKRGFNNMFRVEYVAVNVASLEKVEAAEVGVKEMLQAGIVRKASDLIKVLGGGELKSAKTVRAHKFSEAAIKKIEQAGGKAVVIGND